jgi:hypothetical protein
MGVGALSWGNLWDTTLLANKKSEWQNWAERKIILKSIDDK